MQILQAMHWNPYNKSPGGAPGTSVRSDGGMGGQQWSLPGRERPPTTLGGLWSIKTKTLICSSLFFFLSPPTLTKEETGLQLSEETPVFKTCPQAIWVLLCKPSPAGNGV